MRSERDIDADIDDEVQRSIDDAALQDAYLEGQRAGMDGVRAGCNPWGDPYSAEYKRWEAGRSAGEAERLSRALRRRVA